MARLLAVDLHQTYFGDNPVKDYTATGSDFGRLISSMLPTVLVVASFILFIYMIFGGFLLISSSGDSKKTEEGQQALTNAIIGFVIIFTSYWLIQIIEIITGVHIL
jgi:uncharacterized membrane protein